MDPKSGLLTGISAVVSFVKVVANLLLVASFPPKNKSKIDASFIAIGEDASVKTTVPARSK
jgi:hypothetical protein